MEGILDSVRDGGALVHLRGTRDLYARRPAKPDFPGRRQVRPILIIPGFGVFLPARGPIRFRRTRNPAAPPRRAALVNPSYPLLGLAEFGRPIGRGSSGRGGFVRLASLLGERTRR